jgi:hypothetical protein
LNLKYSKKNKKWIFNFAESTLDSGARTALSPFEGVITFDAGYGKYFTGAMV